MVSSFARIEVILVGSKEMTDCKFYTKEDDKEFKGGCKVLTERVCEKKNCSFYISKNKETK